jgi:uncharacterized membrane protein
LLIGARRLDWRNRRKAKHAKKNSKRTKRASTEDARSKKPRFRYRFLFHIYFSLFVPVAAVHAGLSAAIVPSWVLSLLTNSISRYVPLAAYLDFPAAFFPASFRASAASGEVVGLGEAAV